MKKATIQDVATIANTRKEIVSKFIKGEKLDKKLSEQIASAIKSSGYIIKKKTELPGTAAKTTSSRKTVMRNFNFVYICETSLFPRTRNIIESLQDICLKNNCRLSCVFTHNDKNAIDDTLANLKKENVDGVFVEDSPFAEDIQAFLKKAKINHLFLNCWKSKIDAVNFDEELAGEVLGNFAISKQNLIVRYLGYQENTAGLREKGIRNAYQKRNQPFDFAVHTCGLSYLEMFEKISEILREQIDLLILGFDEMAVPLNKYLKEYNIHVPENLSLISFGGHPFTQVVSPSLTSVQYNYEAFSNEIFSNLCAIIDNKDIPPLKSSFELVEGESTRK